MVRKRVVRLHDRRCGAATSLLSPRSNLLPLEYVFVDNKGEVYYATELSGQDSRDFGLSKCFVQRHVWGAKPYAGRNFASLVNSRGAEIPSNWGRPESRRGHPPVQPTRDWLSGSARFRKSAGTTAEQKSSLTRDAPAAFPVDAAARAMGASRYIDGRRRFACDSESVTFPVCFWLCLRS